MLNTMLAGAVAAMAMLSATSVSAADTKMRPFTVTDQTTRTECGECHMAFPASKLTTKAWKTIMGTLDDHFGEDASLDAATVKHIEAYLGSHALDAKMGIRTKMRLAAWAKKGIVDPLRISETPEWTRHHTKSRNYKDMAKRVGYDGPNCIKCHKGAERGLYEDFGD